MTYDFDSIIAKIPDVIAYKVRRLKPVKEEPIEEPVEQNRIVDTMLYCVDHDGNEYRLSPHAFMKEIGNKGLTTTEEILRRIDVFKTDPECYQHQHWRLWYTIKRIKDKFKTVEVYNYED